MGRLPRYHSHGALHRHGGLTETICHHVSAVDQRKKSLMVVFVVKLQEPLESLASHRTVRRFWRTRQKRQGTDQAQHLSLRLDAALWLGYHYQPAGGPGATAGRARAATIFRSAKGLLTYLASVYEKATSGWGSTAIPWSSGSDTG